jgi:predicted  nucleic acid-binding Zn-ribbon protein
MQQFKTLADARSAYEVLEVETADLRSKVANIATLEAQLAEKTAFGSDTAKENENLRLLIVQYDQKITGLNAEKAVLKSEVTTLKTTVEALEKNQKTAKQHARDLVAASGGAPVRVDANEIHKMQAGTEAEYKALMLAERDPERLAQLYLEYNKLFRTKKK